MRTAVQGCRGCPLYRNATQAVFGRGKRRAGMMLVGEVPGDREDLEGRPFVGPAGRLLRDALDLAGITPDDLYVTNAVKHFKFLTKGFKRFHKKPDDREIRACRPWVMKEIDVVQPEVLVCLGATAAQSLLGKQVRITRDHGVDLENTLAPHAVVTWHPSAILRMPSEDRDEGMKTLVKDLSKARALSSRH